MIGEKDEMAMEKAKVFCEFFLSYKLDGVEREKLLEKYRKYIEDLANFHYYKSIFKNNTIERERERLFDMREMRVKNL